MGAMLRTILFAILAVFLTASVSAVSYQNGLPTSGCAIQTQYGLEPDRDCDGVNDFSDNCKFTPNSRQSDSNRNGIGDACDLLVTQIFLDPGTEVQQNQPFTVKVQLINNKPYAINDVQARIRNNDLGIDSASFIDELKPGEQRTMEFVLNAAVCGQVGIKDLTFTTDHKEGEKVYTQTLYQRIKVLKTEGVACTAAPTALDRTVLDTIASQDVALGATAIYPITLTNLNGETKTYRLGLEPINAIGTYRLDPASFVTVPAGKTETLYLHIQTERFAPVGRNTVHLTIESEGKVETVELNLRIIKTMGVSTRQLLVTVVQLSLILVVLALIIGAAIIAYKKMEHDDGDGKGGVEPITEKESFETYY